MTPIARPASEPNALRDVRARKLPEVNRLHAIGALDKLSKLLDGYDVAKPALAEMQHTKCCYCEKIEEQAKYRDVEHYRPKSKYWWLTWSWDNLLFACNDCNRQCKGAQFPLGASQSLPVGQAPPGLEDAQVLDPSDFARHPMDHVVYRRSNVQGIEQWRPFGKTTRGAQTIAVCGLDRETLLDLYGKHVRTFVRPLLRPMELAISTSQGSAVELHWLEALSACLSPASPFRALSHDALDVLVPAATRSRYGLQLLRPE